MQIQSAPLTVQCAGVVSEQIKTRLEVASDERGTKVSSMLTLHVADFQSH